MVMMVTRGVIYVLMMEDVDISLKRPGNLPIEMVEKVLMVIVYMDIVPIPETLPPISQVTMVDC